MVNKKISELDPAATITGAEVIPLLQGGATKAATVQQLLALLTAAAPGNLDTFFEVATQMGLDETTVATLQALVAGKADATTIAATYAYPIIDTGAGYTARPSTVPAGLALYKGSSQPTDALTNDRWEPTYTTPRPIIIDTDWYTDVDDVVAMRIAAYYEKIASVDILACVIDTTAVAGATSLDGFWRSESRPMTIGQLPGLNSDLSAPGPYQATLNALPHYGTSSGDFPDSTTVYRTALASAADGTVDIVSVGYLNALQALLQSPGDTIDARTGAALVAAKVRRVYMMGGLYPSGTENNFSRSPKAIAAAAYVIGNWPATVPIYFSGYEVGVSVITGGTLGSLAPASDPVYAALVAHGSATGRNSWDPMTVTLACIGDPTAAGYTTVRGTNTINATTGANTFTTSSTGPHYYLVKAQPDTAFQTAINSLLIPGRQPAPKTGTHVLAADGAWRAQSWKDKRLGAASPIIAGSTLLPLAQMRAADVAVADGATVATVASNGATTFPAWNQATAGNQPTYRASVSGTKGGASVSYPCLQFAGSQWLETASAVQQGVTETVYARVMWATLPTTNQTVVSDDDGTNSVSPVGRSFHLKGITGGVAQSATFVNFSGTSAGLTDNVTGLAVNTWHVIALRRTSISVETFIDATTDGATNRTDYLSPLAANTKIHIGASKYAGTSATEGLVGYVAEVRVYAGTHSTAQMTAITAAM